MNVEDVSSASSSIEESEGCNQVCFISDLDSLACERFWTDCLICVHVVAESKQRMHSLFLGVVIIYMR